MAYGICNLSVVPCRKEPSDKSEMVSQLLFGETFKVLNSNKSWVQIRTPLDGYESWIDKKQFAPLSKEDFKKLAKKKIVCSSDLVDIITHEDGSHMPVTVGSTLPFYRAGKIRVGEERFTFDGEVCKPARKNLQDIIVEHARVFYGAPYLWGGRSPFGVDCSGFTQVVYKMAGIELQRDAYQQAEQGVTLSFIEEAEPGDIAFFDNKEGEIIHVGIIISPNMIIHASGKVRIDPIDNHGIYHKEMRDYSHHLRLIKRLTD